MNMYIVMVHPFNVYGFVIPLLRLVLSISIH